jgi:hypothetical protein
MKRNFIIGFFGLSAAALLGCPVFSGGGGGSETCNAAEYAAGCIPCYSGYDCNPGQICDGTYCIATPGHDAGSPDTGEDGGDCSTTGCGKGQICAVVDGGAVCIANPDGGGRDGSTDSGTDSGPPFTGCINNAACNTDGGTGALCLDGTCVSAANQCTDTTQCPNSEQCVQGACVPACSASMPCPTGYACQFPGDAGTTGVCTGNPTPCGAAADAGTCAKGTTCVDEHCVADCSSGDASCPAGLICVDHGCVPNQRPVFVCDTDGQSGDGKKGECDVGSICLHHSCYISCNPKGSSSCETAAKFNECKEVTESTSDGGTGTYYVCGSSTNLGNQCSPTGTQCPGSEVCIDGYCE